MAECFVRFFSLLLAVVMLSACASSQFETEVSQNTNFEITPYLTSTDDQIDPSKVPVLTPTPPPLPTPTPFIYIVVTGDNFITVAARFNITYNELLIANPDVGNPSFLSVGTELIIPTGEGDGGPPSLEAPTPVPVIESLPRCYPTASGGLWCFLLVQNDRLVPLENLSALVSLYDSRGMEQTSRIALTPLNVLWPGESMPLVAYFPPQAPPWDKVQAQLLTSLEVPTNEERYLTAVVENSQIQISGKGLQGRVSGIVRLQDEQKSASYVWLAAVAYGADGAVVGVRRWERVGIESGGRIEFDFLVFSLGPTIESIDILVEAGP